MLFSWSSLGRGRYGVGQRWTKDTVVVMSLLTMHTYQEKGNKGIAVALDSSAMGAKEGKRNTSEGPQGMMVA